MDIVEGRLVVRARLAGHERAVVENAMIDTGATITIIPPETAEILQLERHPALSQIQVTTASGVLYAGVRVASAIEVAGVRVEGLPVVVYALPSSSPVAVLIGMDFLRQTRLVVDGKANSFEVVDP